MRGFVTFLLVAAAVAILLYLMGREEKKPVESTPSQATAPAVVSQPPAPPPATPAPRATPPPVVNKQSVAAEYAQRARVELVGYAQQGSEATIQVQWSSNNTTQGADVIDLMLKDGIIRDFQDVPPGLSRGQTPDGRPVYRTAFKVFFR